MVDPSHNINSIRRALRFDGKKMDPLQHSILDLDYRGLYHPRLSTAASSRLSTFQTMP